MANELNNSFALTFNKGGVSISRNSGTANVTVSGSAYHANVESVGIVDEALDLGGVGTIGYVLLHNLDAINFMTLGEDGSSYPIKLKASEWALLRWNGAAIHALSNTAPCLLEYVIVAD